MTNQTHKHLPLNHEQDEGTIILPGCQLLIKYRNEEQQAKINVVSSQTQTFDNRREKLTRTLEDLNKGKATISEIQRDLLDLLMQMAVMRDPANRAKLLPFEYRRQGSWDYSDHLETDLKRIIDKNNTVSLLNDVIVTCMNFASNEQEMAQFSKLRFKLKAINSVQKEKNREAMFGNYDHDSQLLYLIDKHFDEEELKTICFRLGIEYDNLPALGKFNKTRELIQLLKRTDRVPEVIVLCNELRPKVDWPSPSHWKS